MPQPTDEVVPQKLRPIYDEIIGLTKNTRRSVAAWRPS